MSWTEQGKLRRIDNINGVTSLENVWILRGYDWLGAIDAETHGLMWQQPLSGDHSYGYKSVVGAGQCVVTTAHRDSERDNVWVMAFQANSGEFVWERRIGWRLNNNLGGLLVHGNKVLFVEAVEAGYQFVVLNTSSGEAISTSLAPEVMNSGLMQLDSSTAVVAGDRAYFCVAGDGLYGVDLSRPGHEFSKLASGNAKMLTVAAPFIGCLMNNTSPELAIFNAKDDNVTTIPLPNKFSASNLINITVDETSPEILITGSDLAGSIIIHLSEQHNIQHHPWSIQQAIATPFGVLAVKEDKTLITLEAGQTYPVEFNSSRLVGTLYYLQDNLCLVDARRGAKIVAFNH